RRSDEGPDAGFLCARLDSGAERREPEGGPLGETAERPHVPSGLVHLVSDHGRSLECTGSRRERAPSPIALLPARPTQQWRNSGGLAPARVLVSACRRRMCGCARTTATDADKALRRSDAGLTEFVADTLQKLGGCRPEI